MYFCTNLVSTLCYESNWIKASNCAFSSRKNRFCDGLPGSADADAT